MDNISITPSNQNSNAKVSYRNGQNILSFHIGSQDRMILPDKVRLCGELSIYKSDGVLATAGDKIMMNERLGIYSCISAIIIKNGHGQTLEHLKSYNRFCGTRFQATQSVSEGMTIFNNESLEVPNYELFRKGVVEHGQATGMSFCISLVSGLLSSSNPIPLSSTWGLNGIFIDVILNSDADTLYHQDGTGASISDAYYEWENVKLIAEVLTPDEQTIQEISSQKQQQLVYNSYTAYYTTINSRNSVINFTLNLKNCISVFANFIQSKMINNRSYDGGATLYPLNKTGTPAVIQELVFTRGGVAYPQKYQITTIQQGQEDTALLVDPQVSQTWLNAVSDWSDNHQKLQVSTANDIYDWDGEVDDNTIIDGGNCFGVGIRLSKYDNGVDFTNQTFGMNLTLDLTTDSPNSVFLFVKNKNMVLFDSTGLQVIS